MRRGRRMGARVACSTLGQTGVVPTRSAQPVLQGENLFHARSQSSTQWTGWGSTIPKPRLSLALSSNRGTHLGQLFLPARCERTERFRRPNQERMTNRTLRRRPLLNRIEFTPFGYNSYLVSVLINICQTLVRKNLRAGCTIAAC